MVLNKNPSIPEVPCHRVVRSNGEVRGYVNEIEKKIELLESEGILIKDKKIINFEKYFFRFDRSEIKT